MVYPVQTYDKFLMNILTDRIPQGNDRATVVKSYLRIWTNTDLCRVLCFSLTNKLILVCICNTKKYLHMYLLNTFFAELILFVGDKRCRLVIYTKRTSHSKGSKYRNCLKYDYRFTFLRIVLYLLFTAMFSPHLLFNWGDIYRDQCMSVMLL